MDFKYKCFGLMTKRFSSDRGSLLKVYIMLHCVYLYMHVHTLLNITINLLLECISILGKTLKPVFRKLLYNGQVEYITYIFPSGTEAKSQRHGVNAQGINKKLEEFVPTM